MANQPAKYNRDNRGTYLNKHNWEVMKPFVHFGFKALVLIGSAVIGIIKLVPALLRPNDQPKKDTRIIKI
ncbi:hypothetical protein [Mucilaginibacter sp. dw_454]|uniref:hypothetical protein n=1 Tax=Mucilaginibacter sp. dw_454 TaxID=2720079 RepID=UPI001BD38E7C|nr:hypothetical protein [Mucilaginibacter sp. dw_454]